MKFSTLYVVKSLVLGLQRAPENSVLAPSLLVLYDLGDKEKKTITSYHVLYNSISKVKSK